jgi:hypothetical protein
MAPMTSAETTPATARPVSWGLSLDQVWAIMAVLLPLMVVGGGLAAIDLAYHIRAGDLMLERHEILRSDPFSFTAAGLPWRDQQWGAQVLLALAFRPLGWLGFSVLKVLLAGVTFLFVYLACREAGAGPRTGAALTLGSSLVVFGGMPLRPQLFGAALFALTLWLVTARRRHPRLVWLVPVAVLLWSNVHGSFVLGPLLVGLAWVEDRYRRGRTYGRTSLVLLASVVASMINPFGPWIWVWAVRLSTNPVIARLIQEWQPPSIRQSGDVFFFASVAATGAFLARRGRPAPWPSIMTLGIFLLFALLATRNVLWWGLAAPVVIAGLKNERPGDPGSPASGLNTAIAASVGLVLVTFLSLSFVTGSLRSPSENLSFAPQGITAELERALEPGDRMFNSQRWGSWFEVALPDHPVFIDSRPTVFPDEVWDQYVDVSTGQDGWQSILDRWRIRVVVADRERQGPLIPLLRRDPGWTQIYEDDEGMIFVRA